MQKPELLAPAGDFTRLLYAIEYGADAVYVGGEEFSLRTASANFKNEELRHAVSHVHSKHKKIYLACNTVPRNEEIDRLPEYAEFIADIGIDAVIISDLGSFSVFKRYAPKMDIHISTQANPLNYETCRIWHAMGAKRIVLARELSLEEITEIREKTPSELELEAFVHGAMCMAHSGRCLISDFLTGRSSNRGNCAQPCRWKYALTEEKREGEYYPVFEGDNGSFILNSKDVCMIEHIPDLCNAGITSLKIEGRVKTEYYVACITNAYRQAIDDCFADLDLYTKNIPKYKAEAAKVSHREYYTGFYYKNNETKGQNYKDSSYIRDYELIGIIEGYDSINRRLKVTQKNKFIAGDECEILEAGKEVQTFRIEKMYDVNGDQILSAPHPEMTVFIDYNRYVGSHTFLRKKKY